MLQINCEEMYVKRLSLDSQDGRSLALMVPKTAWSTDLTFTPVKTATNDSPREVGGKELVKFLDSLSKTIPEPFIPWA